MSNNIIDFLNKTNVSEYQKHARNIEKVENGESNSEFIQRIRDNNDR